MYREKERERERERESELLAEDPAWSYFRQLLEEDPPGAGFGFVSASPMDCGLRVKAFQIRGSWDWSSS